MRNNLKYVLLINVLICNSNLRFLKLRTKKSGNLLCCLIGIECVSRNYK